MTMSAHDPGDRPPTPGAERTARRKLDHLALVRDRHTGPRAGSTWLEHVRLIHCALPELAWEELDLRQGFAGRTLAAPLLITGISGGVEQAGLLNRDLAAVVEELGLGLGLGSLRPALEDAQAVDSFSVRAQAPTAWLAGNIGGPQLVRYGPRRVADLLERLGLDAVAVHLNPAQELMQPEGDRDFRGVLDALVALQAAHGGSVLVKEVGCGLSRDVARSLADRGLRSLDVAGAGGTSWVGVELLRQGRDDDPERAALWDWGLPTAASLVELRDLDLELVASGGLRTGLDLARALALGATVGGVAAPVVRAWFAGGRVAVAGWIGELLDGLRRVLLLCGCRTPAELRVAPRVLVGPLERWQERRGRPA